MPTYEELRAYFLQSKPLQGAAEKASVVPLVSGVTLNVDSLWCALYDQQERLADPVTSARTVEAIADVAYRFGRYPLTSLDDSLSLTYQGFRRRDLYRKVESWENGLRSRASTSPVVMTIVHRPLRGAVLEAETLQSLVDIAAESGGAVRIQERSRARFALAAGETIRAAGRGAGTLGGVMRDDFGKLYGVTCDHVTSAGDRVLDAAGKEIGSCTASTSRAALAKAAVCDPVTLQAPNGHPGNGPQVNMLDCALIDLRQPASGSSIAGTARSLSPGQNVVLRGAVSGKTFHKLGSLCLSYAFLDGNQSYCFRDVIELVPQPRGPFGGIIGQVMATVPTQGDSGGWVTTDDEPAEWAGMFFGEDGRRSFAIRAAWIHDWAEKTVGHSLRV